MSTVNEPFNGTGALPAGWTDLINSHSCVAGIGTGQSSASDNFSQYTGQNWGNDQTSQVTVVTVTAGTNFIELPIRMSGSSLVTFNAMFAYTDGTKIVLAKYVNGTQTDIRDTGNTCVATDTLLLSGVGSTFVVKKNGSALGSPDTDTSVTGGYNGIGSFNVGAFDNWIGTDVRTALSGFRGRKDNGSETTASWSALENTNYIYPKDVNHRLRVQLNSAEDPSSAAYRLEYKKSTETYYGPILTAAPSVPTFQGFGTTAAGTGSGTPTWPVHQAGDIGWLVVESCGGEAVSLTTANGFVAVDNSPQATGAGTAGTRLTVYWCRATSNSMLDPVVAAAGDHIYSFIFTTRGGIADGNPWNITAGGVKASASTSVSITGVTTTVNNCLMMYLVTKDLDSAAAFTSAQANASLSGITEQADAGTTAGNGGGVSITTGILATAGASGTFTATVTSSINAFITIAVAPLSYRFVMSASSNIAAGGEATTALLSSPSGKTGSDFTTGRMWDDENGSDSIDIGSNKYTELEWCFQMQSAQGVVDGHIYNFRVTNNGVPLEDYTYVPAVTIGALAKPAAPHYYNRTGEQ